MRPSSHVLFAVLGFVGVAIGFSLWSSPSNEARLTILNQSEQSIAGLTVQVSGQVFSLGTLAPKENKEARINRFGDSHWTIDGAWPDGQKIHQEIGYITNGMSFDDRAIFGKDRKLILYPN